MSTGLSLERWPAEKAQAWYDRQPWIVGCNFIPSTAINQLEMWQEETFDPGTIDRELGWAAGIGLNTVRVYLHNLAWADDGAGFKARVNRFLDLAARHGIRAILVIFDDCWNADPKVGPQPAPIPGVHNSGWMQSPGVAIVNKPSAWLALELYVHDIVGSFGADKRVLAWDLYNEPGNSSQGMKTMPLLQAVFQWAREAAPTQPLTAGMYCDNKEFNEYQIATSDVISFHNYNGADDLARQIGELKKHKRGLICTEWLRRGHSEVAANLPIFHRERVGCCNWGLVSGKTQTIFPWGSPQGATEPALWFHDLFKKDGAPFNPQEVALFQKLTARAAHV
jgi:hypothetical protein